MGYRTKQRILAEKSSMAKKHLKKCSTPLVIREMQIKTNLRFNLTRVRIAKIKKFRWQQMLVRMWRKRNTPPFLVGLQTYTTTLEINLEVSQKIGNRSTWRPSYTTLENIPKRCPPWHKGTCSTIMNDSQKLETTQMSLIKRMDTENVVHLHNGILLSY